LGVEGDREGWYEEGVEIAIHDIEDDNSNTSVE
jgi:hypothetical protein